MSSFENMLKEFGNELMDDDDTMNVDSLTDFDLSRSIVRDDDENRYDKMLATNSSNELFSSVLTNSVMKEMLEDNGNGNDDDDNDLGNRKDGNETEEKRISESSICTECKYGKKESIDIVDDNIDKDLLGVKEKRELILKRSSFDLIRDSKMIDLTMKSKDLEKSVSEGNLFSVKRRRKDDNDNKKINSFKYQTSKNFDDNKNSKGILKKLILNDDRIERNEKRESIEYVDYFNIGKNLVGNSDSMDKKVIEVESFVNKDIESFLEISAESETIKIGDKDFEIRGERIEKISNDSVPDSTISVAIDSTNHLDTLDRKEKEIAELDKEKEKEKEETLTENKKKLIKENFPSTADDFFSSQFLSESELENIEREALNNENKTNKEKLEEIDFGIKKIIDNKNKENIFYKPELEIIDKEILINENVEVGKLNIGKAKSIKKKNDIFYKPEVKNVLSEEIFNVPSIPNWVTNPATEPNYEKIRHAYRMKKECVRKMLNEVLRLR